DRGAEHDKVKSGRQHRRGDALHQCAERARHLETVDRPDRVHVHARLLTRPTKMSSSELSAECRSLISMPSSLRRLRSPGMPVSRLGASKLKTSAWPSCDSSSG